VRDKDQGGVNRKGKTGWLRRGKKKEINKLLKKTRTRRTLAIGFKTDISAMKRRTKRWKLDTRPLMMGDSKEVPMT